MPSPSSTSSFELTPLERITPGRIPVAALVFLLCVAGVEIAARTSEAWFADLASWQWRTKAGLLESGTLDGSIPILGSSILFHGLDPRPANEGAPARARLVNLALNGMQLQHQAQMFRRQLDSAAPPVAVVLEFKNVLVERESWIRGPYYRFWASTDEFAESRFYYFEPSLGLSFAAYRALPTLRSREALNNWLTESAASRRLRGTIGERNCSVELQMAAQEGLVFADFEHISLAGARKKAIRQTWDVNAPGEIWLTRLMNLAAERELPVVLLVPPAPPYFVDDGTATGFRARFDEYLRGLHRRYPSLNLEVFAPTGFGLEHFTDDRHFSREGRQKLTNEFADWFQGYRTRHPGLGS